MEPMQQLKDAIVFLHISASFLPILKLSNLPLSRLQSRFSLRHSPAEFSRCHPRPGGSGQVQGIDLMKWFSSATETTRRHHKENFCAVLVALGAVTVLYFSYDPSPAGANPNEIAFDASAMKEALSETSISPADSASGNTATGEVGGRLALLMQSLLLEKGLERIEAVPDYMATFLKQEKIDGVMSEPNFMQVKIRHEPFSVYMKWVDGGDVGREVLYVDGKNDNEMLVKLGGVKGRMMPTLKVNPTGSVAMAEARYPVTNMGVKKMIEKILEAREEDLKISRGVSCRMIDNQKFNKRDCFCFQVEYETKEVSPQHFRKSLIYIDKETYFPICVKNFSFAPDGQEDLTGKELDEATLCEFYSYSNIVLDDRLAAAAFDKTNSNYQFRR
jgi:hypothetical protein